MSRATAKRRRRKAARGGDHRRRDVLVLAPVLALPVAAAARCGAAYQQVLAEDLALGLLPSPALADLVVLLTRNEAADAALAARRRRGAAEHRVWLLNQPEPVSKLADTGTDGTKRRLRADVLARLLGQGKLARHHVEAADAIAEVQQAVAAALSPRAELRDPNLRVDCTPVHLSPIERVPAPVRRIWATVYRPWMADLHADPPVFDGAVYHGALKLVQAIAGENMGPDQVERRWGLRRGSAVPVLRAALERYAVVAGWRRASAAEHRRPPPVDLATVDAGAADPVPVDPGPGLAPAPRFGAAAASGPDDTRD